jgi:ADP-ribose pyrophosphatase YjhB (NUDIX family)
MQPAPPVRRDAARVLLIDQSERVLLIRSCDPDRAQRSFWCPPGGALEPGESPRDGALRELAEETGLAGVTLGPLVWTRVAEFTVRGLRYRSDEVFFLARLVEEAAPIEPGGYPRQRWWSLAALQASGEVTAPPDLAARLADLLRDGPPASPVAVAGAALP